MQYGGSPGVLAVMLQGGFSAHIWWLSIPSCETGACKDTFRSRMEPTCAHIGHGAGSRTTAASHAKEPGGNCAGVALPCFAWLCNTSAWTHAHRHTHLPSHCLQMRSGSAETICRAARTLLGPWVLAWEVLARPTIGSAEPGALGPWRTPEVCT